MLTCYDLYDLHAILVCIRADPTDPFHAVAVSCVLEVLQRRDECHDLNQIRAAIAPHLGEGGGEAYAFCGVENAYTYFPDPALKKEEAYRLLIAACEHLLTVLQSRNTEQIVALADCLHNLPILLLREAGEVPRSFRQRELKAYRKRWDKGFLSDI